MKAQIHATGDDSARQLWSARAILFITGLYLALAPSGVRAEGATRSTLPAKAKNVVKPVPHGASKPRTAKRGASSHTPDMLRRSAMRPEPQRVQEIQQALIESGELHQEPTGRWDEATRDAMKRYQEEHGFSVTGLPDAKSIMKMGLGPHPLPPQAEAVSTTGTGFDAGPPAALPAPPSDEPPASAGSSQQHR